MLVYTETTFNLAKLYREVYFRFASEFQYVILSERDWLGGRAKPLPCLHVGQRGKNTCRLSAFVVVPVCGTEGKTRVVCPILRLCLCVEERGEKTCRLSTFTIVPAAIIVVLASGLVRSSQPCPERPSSV